MEFQIVIIAICILLVSWALERILRKMQTLERHVQGFRTRINFLEQRIVGMSKSFAVDTISTVSSSTEVPKTYIEGQTSHGGKTECQFCGEIYDEDMDKCPKCNHINIEKYRLKKKRD